MRENSAFDAKAALHPTEEYGAKRLAVVRLYAFRFLNQDQEKAV